ncbi:hypothetical protein BT69DRAFT_441153 [Atractiella rhizophila]|nr:hypothetical protein BT69DRAFT_441153 [Atractiella rhizophila]
MVMMEMDYLRRIELGHSSSLEPAIPVSATMDQLSKDSKVLFVAPGPISVSSLDYEYEHHSATKQNKLKKVSTAAKGKRGRGSEVEQDREDRMARKKKRSHPPSSLKARQPTASADSDTSSHSNPLHPTSTPTTTRTQEDKGNLWSHTLDRAYSSSSSSQLSIPPVAQNHHAQPQAQVHPPSSYVDGKHTLDLPDDPWTAWSRPTAAERVARDVIGEPGEHPVRDQMIKREDAPLGAENQRRTPPANLHHTQTGGSMNLPPHPAMVCSTSSHYRYSVPSCPIIPLPPPQTSQYPLSDTPSLPNLSTTGSIPTRSLAVYGDPATRSWNVDAVWDSRAPIVPSQPAAYVPAPSHAAGHAIGMGPKAGSGVRDEVKAEGKPGRGRASGRVASAGRGRGRGRSTAIRTDGGEKKPRKPRKKPEAPSQFQSVSLPTSTSTSTTNSIILPPVNQSIKIETFSLFVPSSSAASSSSSRSDVSSRVSTPLPSPRPFSTGGQSAQNSRSPQTSNSLSPRNTPTLSEVSRTSTPLPKSLRHIMNDDQQHEAASSSPIADKELSKDVERLQVSISPPTPSVVVQPAL